jgi:hypothetical protein
VAAAAGAAGALPPDTRYVLKPSLHASIQGTGNQSDGQLDPPVPQWNLRPKPAVQVLRQRVSTPRPFE